jgi:2-keto-4-pentenoate hydratase
MRFPRGCGYPVRYGKPQHPADTQESPDRGLLRHIANGAFVVGEAQKHWRDLEFATMPVRVSTDANILVETIGGHPFLDPFPAAVVLVNELRRGSGLQTGQVMATGAFSGFFPVQANQPIVAEFEGVGRATAMFVS